MNRIHTIAEINGYNSNLVDSILEKFQTKKVLEYLTTLTPLNNNKEDDILDDSMFIFCHTI